jgi:site-specific recombinase XerC
LQAAPRTARSHAEVMSDRARVDVVRRLLGDQRIDLRDRVGGCLLLIYAQPLTRIVGLTVDQVTVTGDQVTIALGNGPLELPEPLAQLTATLVRDRRVRASTAASSDASRWLFPGMRVGRPLDYSHFQRRLSRLGIPPLPGRTGAVIALAGALPPTILAELLGISETTASKWYGLAGGEYNRYAAQPISSP